MQKTGFLGIDVSKGYADFLLLNEKKEPLGISYKLYDTAQGHEKMYARICSDMNCYGLDSVLCGVESTGGYENNWYNDLLKNGLALSIEVVRLNPIGVKHQGESKMTRTITDKVSAQLIAYQLIENKQVLLSTPKPSIEQSQARRFYSYITSLKKQQTALLNQLEKLVYTAFPEVLTYTKSGFPNWLLLLQSEYPGYKSIRATELDNLLKIKGISVKKASELQAKANSSIGLEDVLLNRAISGLANQILQLKNKIKEEKKYLEKNYTSPQVELLNEIDGIGVYSAIGMMMEIEDVNRFAGAEKMASFFGVHPVFKKSGDGQWKPRMSKKGSAGFRAIMYMAARNVVNHNDYFKAIYAKFRAKGMKDGDAIGVIMHKLTRVAYGMLKSMTPFNPEVDRKNQERSTKQQTEVQTQEAKETIEEEIETIKNAPCSNRTLKRKKAELEPQTLSTEVNTETKSEYEVTNSA